MRRSLNRTWGFVHSFRSSRWTQEVADSLSGIDEKPDGPFVSSLPSVISVPGKPLIVFACAGAVWATQL